MSALPDKEPARSLARAEIAFRDKRYGEADGIAQDVLRAYPQQPGALALRAFVATRQNQPKRAIGFLEPAVKAQPQVAMWRSLLADLYRSTYRLDEALALAQEAIRLDPKRPGNLVNLAKILVDRGQSEDAVGYCFAALALDPEDPNAHLCLGQILLARREFKPGWIEYEWRNKLEQAQGRFPPVRAPLWNGMNHKGAKILLMGDQGYGDSIQFARYIPEVAQRCGEVLLACSADLQPLFSKIPGVGACYHKWAEVPGFTAYALLSSLPGILGTEPDEIPAAVPYLEPDPARVAAWDRRFREEAGSVPRVGIFWSGRPTHPNNARRTVSLAEFAALATVPEIAWISIQKEVPRADAAAFARIPGLYDSARHLTDFGETAAAIANLDLLISVDSAVVHLAGALGKPVWMLTPSPADWRWQLERSDSPWYPSLRLFRQPHAGDWDAVFAAVAQALGEWRGAWNAAHAAR